MVNTLTSVDIFATMGKTDDGAEEVSQACLNIYPDHFSKSNDLPILLHLHILLIMLIHFLML